MYDLSNGCLNLMMAFATCWIIEKFYAGIFEKKDVHHGVIVIWGVYWGLQLLIESNRGNASIGLTIINILFIIILGIVTYEYTIKTMIFVVLSLCFMWSLCEMLVYFGLKFTNLPSVEADILGTVISKIMVIIVIGVISIFAKSKKNIYLSVGTYFLLMIIPLGSICLAVSEFFQYQYSLTSLFKFALLILFNLTSFQLYFYMAEKFAVEHEKRIYEQQIEYLTRNEEDDKRIMDEFYEEKHNLKNVLLSMRSDIESNDKATVLEGLGRILDNIEQNSWKVQSGDKNVDAILNGKFTVAADKKVMVQHDIKLPKMHFVDTYDMAVLLGDALDNAIEAAERCDEGTRYINVIMGVKRSTFVVVVENCFNGVLRIDGSGNLVSTKSDSYKHGYGMRSINRIVDKYEGNVLIEHEKETFKIIITIPVGIFDNK